MDKWLQNITVVRIAALVLGILLWFVVNIDQQPIQGTPTPKMSSRTIINSEITTIGFDDKNYFLKLMQPTKVSVTIQGNKNLLDKMVDKNLQVQVDLSNVTEGKHTLSLTLLGLTSGLEFDISPSEISVTIEKKVLNEIPVTIDIEGKPEKGLIVGTPIMDPNRVRVMLASSMINDVASIRAKVNIDGAKSAVTKEVKLVAYDKEGKVVDAVIEPAVINVEVPITVPFKLMPLKIRITGQPQDGFSIASLKQSVDQVTVFAPQNILDTLEFYDGFTVDLSKLKNDKLYEVEIRLNDNITLLDPKKVEIDILVVPSETKVIPNVPIVISGLNDSYDTKVNDPLLGTVDVIVEGAPTLLEKLTEQDLQVIADVSNLAVGQHDVPLTINLPPFLKLGAAQRTTATVEISEKGAAAAPSVTASPTRSPSPKPTPTASPEPTPSAQGATGDTTPVPQNL